MMEDPRLTAFLRDPTEVFESIEHRHEIWREDPFDVAAVHAEARLRFEELLTRATTPLAAGSGAPPRGRVLLLLGQPGAGKTHLLRAFRGAVHKGRAGFMGYMQLTSRAPRYARYLLSNLIDSLDQPYDETIDPKTSLVRIAAALVSRALEPALAAGLRDDPELEEEEVTDLVCAGADRLIAQPRYQCADLDLLRVLLYLYRPDPRLRARAIKYLRCEDLSPFDRRMLGGIAPRSREEDPERMVEMLGRLMGVLSDTPLALVVCLDQLESVSHLEATEGHLQQALTTICDLALRVPSSIFVVSCLEDSYAVLRPLLSPPALDWLESEPPIRLQDERTAEEAHAIVVTRLQHLYACAGARFDEAAPLYPFPLDLIEWRTGAWRTREIIETCLRYRQRSRKAGRLLPFEEKEPAAPSANEARIKAIEGWEQRFNDALSASSADVPEQDGPLGELLAWAIAAAGEELSSGHRFPATADSGVVHVEACHDGVGQEHLYVALCNHPAQFGHLARQVAQHVKQARASAGDPVLVLARSAELPTAPSVAREVAQALRGGARTVVIQDADFRVMLALREFRKINENGGYFNDWHAEENHLSRLSSLREALDLDRLDRFPAARSAEAAKLASEGAPSARSVRKPEPPPATLLEVIKLGHTRGSAPQEVHLLPAELTRHVAFLGASGSGKTTLALAAIEYLLASGTPVVLIDRKGDLAGYARPETLSRRIDDVRLSAVQRGLLASVDVALFTPGHPEGRPLGIGVVPEGLADMPLFEREEAAAQAAQALADMMAYKHVGKDAALRAILIQAVQVLAEVPGLPVTLDTLVELIAEADPMLVTRVGRLDIDLYNQLVQDVESLALTSAHLFGTDGGRLDVDLLFGLGRHARPGRTRLSIVSTRFLRSEAEVLFWVAHLLFSVLRWTSKHPKDTLQAALLFDEADLYLPTLRQPATKAPMESLLKRGRSAGLSVMLASQRPAELDYRCRANVRTWFLGRIKEPTALQKLRPMLANGAGDVTDELAGQSAGEFFMVNEKIATAFSAHRSVLSTEQLPEAELLTLARRTRDAGKDS